MAQAYQNQNWLQYSPSVLQPSVDFNDEKLMAKAVKNFNLKPAFVMAGYNNLDGFYNPNGIKINRAIGK